MYGSHPKLLLTLKAVKLFLSKLLITLRAFEWFSNRTVVTVTKLSSKFNQRVVVPKRQSTAQLCKVNVVKTLYLLRQ